MLMASAASSGQRTWAIPKINWETDIIPFLLELLNGGFQPFPYNSMAYYCKTNMTSIPTTATVIYEKFIGGWTTMK